MYVVIKGGHNDESHNHNDVGSFMIYVDGKPVIVDAGNMVYTRKTFSAERYSLWNTRSMYHNVPLIGEDGEQRDGKEYRATGIRWDRETLILHLEDAYPGALGVRELVREAGFQDGFRLTDGIELKEPRSVSWTFMTCIRPEVAETHIRMGRLMMSGHEGMRTEVEEIAVTDARMARNFPGAMWRLKLTSGPAAAHRGAFRFRVEEED